MNQKILAIGAIASLSLTQGCANGPDVHREMEIQALNSINTSLTQIGDAYTTMARVEQAKAPPPPPYIPQDPALHKVVSLRAYNGPIGPALEAISKQCGYSFKTIGRPHGAEVIVVVDAEVKPAWEILRHVGLQAGKNAGVGISENRRAIELVYANVEGK